MFKYILVPVPGEANHDAVFRTALGVARACAGHLAFLHVRLDVQQMMVAMSAGDFGGGTGIGEFVDTLQQDFDRRQDRATQAVTTFCQREHLALAEDSAGAAPSATFHVETGAEGRILAAYARAADLTVLGRVREGEPVALDVLEAVLLGSGRPLLIAPSRPPERIGRRIAIAWKDTPEAARAVASATPLLNAAESVTIVAVSDQQDRAGHVCQRLQRCLRWQNPATTVRVIQASDAAAGDALLAAVADAGADLLVMGGYSHSRMREVVFGGFTRRVLRAADLAVLMAH